MSRYKRVTLNPTEGQIADLSAGEAVRLAPHHFSGECPLHLTDVQIKKIMNAAAAGKGCTLKLSAAQIAYNHKHGSGLLKDLALAGVKLVTPYAANAAASGAKAIAGKIPVVGSYVDDLAARGTNAAVNWASNKAQSKLRGEGFLGDAGRWLGHTAVDGVIGALGGSARPPKMAKLKGKGFLGDAGRWLGHTAVDGVIGALGGGVKPKRVRQKGAGWLGDAGRFLGHTAVDGVIGALGGGVHHQAMAMQPVDNQQMLRAALMQKKVRFGGSGLYQ